MKEMLDLRSIRVNRKKKPIKVAGYAERRAMSLVKEKQKPMKMKSAIFNIKSQKIKEPGKGM